MTALGALNVGRRFSTCNPISIARRDRGYARQALTLSGDGPDDPEDDVVYVTGVELIVVAQTFQNSLCKMNAAGFVQRPSGLPASARSAHVVVNICVGQRVLQSRRFSVPCHIRTVKARQRESRTGTAHLTG
jgi:hypothetical protein